MAEYAPIADLVKIIPADTWNCLAEIYKRQPAIMLGELLAKRDRVASQPVGRAGRLLANHPDNPRPR